MKKTIIAIIVLAAFALTSCGSTSTGQVRRRDRDTARTEPPIVESEIPPEPASWVTDLNITYGDVTENEYQVFQSEWLGFLGFTRTAAAPEDLQCKVYISDEELTEEQIADLSGQTAAIENDGETPISGGQWIYVFCETAPDQEIDPNTIIYSGYAYADYA